VALSTLTVSGLTEDATYYFRAGALNWTLAANPGPALSSSTLAAPPGAPEVSAIWLTSAAVSWTAVACQGYELQASPNASFSPVTAFSSTTDAGAATLSLTGLSADTTYYFRVGAIDWNGRRDYAAPPELSTLAPAPVAPFFPAGGVFLTSATVQWTAVASQGYQVDASTAADFSGDILSSASYNGAATVLIDQGLDSATTYYFRVGSLNWGGAGNFTLVGSTRTQLSPKTWTGAVSSLWNTAGNWSPAGVPGPNDSVTIGKTASVSADGTAISFSSLTIGVPGGGVAASLTLSTTVSRGGSVIVYEGAGLTFATSRPVSLDGDLTLIAGSTFSHAANGALQSASVDLTLSGAFNLQGGATMTAAGLGFSGGAANLSGKGTGGGGGTSVNNTGGGGGGHGAAGSPGTGGSGGPAVDSSTGPVLVGSGGGGGRIGAGTGRVGGSGGGAFRVAAAQIQLDGLVDVSGGDGVSGTGSGGGGAGGAVWLTAGVFAGTGTVAARGGAGGDALGGGGAGGRVSIEVLGAGSICGLSFDVSGGTGTASDGGSGTVSSTSTILAPDGLTAFAASTGVIAWRWSASQGATSYQLFSSTGGAGQSPVLGASATYYLAAGLPANTTASYLIRAQSCAGSADSALVSLATLSLSPGPIAAPFRSATPGSVTAAWTTLAGRPQAQSAEGYELDASTAADFSGVVFASSTASAFASTLTVSGLSPNTTYFLRVASLNWSGDLSSFTALGSTATLATPPVTLPVSYLSLYESSATLAWAALPASPPEASSRTSEGFVLEASSTGFGALTPGGLVFSSSTASPLVSTLTVAGLDLGATTWYFRVGSLNWSGAPSYTLLTPLNIEIYPSSSGVSLGTLNAQVFMSTISISSVVVTNRGDVPVTFALYASTVTPGSPWAIGVSTGEEQFVLQAIWNSDAPSDADFDDAFDALLTSTQTSSAVVFSGDQTGVAVPPGESRTLWFRFWRPSSTAAFNKQNLLVNIRGQYP
jgi:hypothetical protein